MSREKEIKMRWVILLLICILLVNGCLDSEFLDIEEEHFEECQELNNKEKVLPSYCQPFGERPKNIIIRICEYDNQPTKEQLSACYEICFSSETDGLFGLSNSNIERASKYCGEKCQDFFGCKPYYKSLKEIFDEEPKTPEGDAK